MDPERLQEFARTRRPVFTVVCQSNPHYYPSEFTVRRNIWVRCDEPFEIDDLETQLVGGRFPSDGLDPWIDYFELHPSKVYPERMYVKFTLASQMF